MTRTFTPQPATRAQVPLLLGLGGPPGAGKTYSALLLAEGIRRQRGGRIKLLDTEGGRSLAYAPRAGQAADARLTFDFDYVPFLPPYAPGDYLDAVRQLDGPDTACIVIDSMSDEHEGTGGVLDWHETELDRMAGNDWSKRDRMTQAAWIKPKRARIAMVGGLMQVKTPMIFCFRAREKTKPIVTNGKSVPTNVGWTPIAPPEIVHSMTLFALLPVKSDGVPMWKGNTAYEDFSIKLPIQFRHILTEGAPITADMGFAMSEWAMGDAAKESSKPAAVRQPPPASAEPSAPEPGSLDWRAWADDVEGEIDAAIDGATLHGEWSARAKTAEWATMKREDPVAAKALREKAAARIGELKREAA